MFHPGGDWEREENLITLYDLYGCFLKWLVHPNHPLKNGVFHINHPFLGTTIEETPL